MNRYLISIITVLTVLTIPRGAFAQNRAIKTIEEQLVKLKAVQITRPEGGFRDFTDDEKAQFREKIAKAIQDRQKILQTIIAQVAILQGRRQLGAGGGQFLIIKTSDLKPIQEAAEKEKAKETTQLLERLIVRSSGREFGDRPGSGQRLQGNQRGTRGQRPVGAPPVTVKPQGRPTGVPETIEKSQGGPTGSFGGGTMERFQNMSEPERDRFRAEMQERRERYMNMSEAEREKFRDEMRKRMMGGGRSPDGGREGSERFQTLSEEERAQMEEQRRQMRERYENMSEAEREKYRAKMRENFGGGLRPRVERGPGGGRILGREDQLKAIETIEEQAATLKAAVLSTGIEDRGRFRDLSEEERTKLREKMATETRERLTAMRAIELQIMKLNGTQLPTALKQTIVEIKDIHELAVKENATQTAEHLQRLIVWLLN